MNDQLNQYKAGPSTHTGTSLFGVKGQAVTALVSFVFGYSLGFVLS